MKTIAYFQIGKNGISEGVIESLCLAFKAHKVVRISCLKSSGRNRDTIERIANDLTQALHQKTGLEFSYRIIGFTIVVARHAAANKK